MEERTYEELLKENQQLRREHLSGKIVNYVSRQYPDKLRQKLCIALTDWKALEESENVEENFTAQLQRVQKAFPELFEETCPADSLPRFLPMGRSRRGHFSEKARSVMGLK